VSPGVACDEMSRLEVTVSQSIAATSCAIRLTSSIGSPKVVVRREEVVEVKIAAAEGPGSSMTTKSVVAASTSVTLLR